MKIVTNLNSILFIILLFFICNTVDAQRPKVYSTSNKKAIKLFEDGIKCLENNKEEDGKNEFIKAIKADSNFIEAHEILAEIEYDLEEYNQSIDEYKKALSINPDFDPRDYYGLAVSQMSVANYEDAKQNLISCLNSPKTNIKTRDLAKGYLNNCDFAIWSVKHPVPFHPVNMGDSINSKENEYYPSVTADDQTFFFTRQTKRRSNSPLVDYIWDEDIYVSDKKNGVWGKAYSIGDNINTYKNEGAACISADGKTMLFVACDRDDGYGSCDIYISKKFGNEWSKPINIGPPINTKYGESQPSLSSDGNTIYFMSDRPGGYGKQDIWKSTKQNDGKWGVPVNLGPKINTAENEGDPFIHTDNQTLYFTSKGHIGMGGYDIYMSRLDEKGEWGEPVNLGYPINTLNDETSLMVDPSGKIAYFSSNRKEGKGGIDIYSFELYPEARPFKVAYVKGKVFDKETTQPLDARFELLDVVSGKLIMDAHSNKATGDFFVCLPSGKDYALHVSKDGYLFYSETFQLKSNSTKIDSLTMNVPLQPIKIGERVVLKNIFFETNKYDLKNESKAELNKLVSFLNDNKTLHVEISGHTDNVGGKADNQILSENRARSVYDYLVNKGIDKSRLSYKGYGDTVPITDNDNDAHRALNRRTEFKIVQ